MYQAGGGPPPGPELRWHDYIESSPRIQQRLATLQPLGGIQKRTTSDVEDLFGFLGGEHRTACREQPTDVA